MIRKNNNGGFISTASFITLGNAANDFQTDNFVIGGKKAKGAPVRDTPYECGMPTITDELSLRFAWDGDVLRIFLADADAPDGQRDVTRAIRQEHVSQGASKVSALPRVRAGLLEAQRRILELGAKKTLRIGR